MKSIKNRLILAVIVVCFSGQAMQASMRKALEKVGTKWKVAAVVAGGITIYSLYQKYMASQSTTPGLRPESELRPAPKKAVKVLDEGVAKLESQIEALFVAIGIKRNQQHDPEIGSELDKIAGLLRELTALRRTKGIAEESTNIAELSVSYLAFLDRYNSEMAAKKPTPSSRPGATPAPTLSSMPAAPGGPGSDSGYGLSSGSTPPWMPTTSSVTSLVSTAFAGKAGAGTPGDLPRPYYAAPGAPEKPKKESGLLAGSFIIKEDPNAHEWLPSHPDPRLVRLAPQPAERESKEPKPGTPALSPELQKLVIKPVTGDAVRALFLQQAEFFGGILRSILGFDRIIDEYIAGQTTVEECEGSIRAVLCAFIHGLPLEQDVISRDNKALCIQNFITQLKLDTVFTTPISAFSNRSDVISYIKATSIKSVLEKLRKEKQFGAIKTNLCGYQATVRTHYDTWNKFAPSQSDLLPKERDAAQTVLKAYDAGFKTKAYDQMDQALRIIVLNGACKLGIARSQPKGAPGIWA
jgi:hypothetical protein